MIKKYGIVSVAMDKDNKPGVAIQDFTFAEPYGKEENLIRKPVLWAMENLLKHLKEG